MLTSLRKRAEPIREPDALDLLLECHDRIRRFTGIATRLASAHAAPPAEVKEAAEVTLRYFTEALPRHSADEDLSLAPRLLEKGVPDEVRTAVFAMSSQHPLIEATLADLAPRWRALVADPRSLPEHAAELERLARVLHGQWNTHLDLEETTIFPAARAHLAASDLAEILREMRARRA